MHRLLLVVSLLTFCSCSKAIEQVLESQAALPSDKESYAFNSKCQELAGAFFKDKKQVASFDDHTTELELAWQAGVKSHKISCFLKDTK